MTMIRISKRSDGVSVCMIPYGNRMGIYYIGDKFIARGSRRTILSGPLSFGQNTPVNHYDLIARSLARDPYVEKRGDAYLWGTFYKIWNVIIEQIPQDIVREILKWRPKERGIIWYSICYGGQPYIDLLNRNPSLACMIAHLPDTPVALRKLLRISDIEKLRYIMRTYCVKIEEDKLDIMVDAIRGVPRRLLSYGGPALDMLGLGAQFLEVFVGHKRFGRTLASRYLNVHINTVSAISKSIRDFDAAKEIVNWYLSNYPTVMERYPGIDTLYAFRGEMKSLAYEDLLAIDKVDNYEWFDLHTISSQLSEDIKFGIDSPFDIALPKTSAKIDRFESNGCKIWRIRTIVELLWAMRISETQWAETLKERCSIIDRVLAGKGTPFCIKHIESGNTFLFLVDGEFSVSYIPGTYIMFLSGTYSKEMTGYVEYEHVKRMMDAIIGFVMKLSIYREPEIRTDMYTIHW